MKNFIWQFFIVLVFYSVLIMAQTIAPAPIPDDGGLAGIFIAVSDLFSDWQYLSYQYKIAGCLFILVAVFKNSKFKPLWDILGKWKPLVAPTLSLIAFLLMVKPFTINTLLAAITTGAAAGYFSQILDALKTIPQVSFISGMISGFISKFIKK